MKLHKHGLQISILGGGKLRTKICELNIKTTITVFSTLTPHVELFFHSAFAETSFDQL